jgi:hypothetical protein
MSLSVQLVTELARGSAYSFANWPNASVPIFGAGVYTIWHNDGRFIYVGMSGRGITAETSRRNTPQGIFTRLHKVTRADAGVAISSAFTGPTDLFCRPYLRRTSLLLPQASPDGCIRASVCNEYQAEASESFEWVKKNGNASNVDMRLKFGTKRDYVPLQAADVLAYEGNRRLRDPSRPERRAFKALSPENERLHVKYLERR